MKSGISLMQLCLQRCYEENLFFSRLFSLVSVLVLDRHGTLLMPSSASPADSPKKKSSKMEFACIYMGLCSEKWGVVNSVVLRDLYFKKKNIFLKLSS